VILILARGGDVESWFDHLFFGDTPLWFVVHWVVITVIVYSTINLMNVLADGVRLLTGHAETSKREGPDREWQPAIGTFEEEVR
jgi:hypothetical protein